MKAILISIKPRFVAKILNGEKIIEIRKTMPKCDLPIDVYIYCTKDNKQRLYPVSLLDKSNQVFKRAYREDKIDNRTNYLNGKVVAKFTLNKVEEIPTRIFSVYTYPYTKTLDDYELLDKSCLYTDELEKYLGKKIGYAWYISNLEIFDKPKELSEFYAYCKDEKCEYRNNHCSICHREPLTKAPKGWCYIESEK